MLDLSVITRDESQAVHCRTLEEAQLLYHAVKEQRPDIHMYGWSGPPDSDRYVDKAYILSWHGFRAFKYGDVEYLRKNGVEIIEFGGLLLQDLPDIEANQTDIFSLLGV